MNLGSLNRDPDLQWGRREGAGAHILCPVKNHDSFQAPSFFSHLKIPLKITMLS